MGTGQVITAPTFFASNAIYPLDIMPGWLRAMARINSLTYAVDAFRALVIQGSVSTFHGHRFRHARFRHGGPDRHRRPVVWPHGVVNLCRLTWIKLLSPAER